MTVVAAEDWAALHDLAGRVGFPSERVSLLRSRFEHETASRPGSPYTLLAGRPDAGIELLLARWIAPEAAEELKSASGVPLVLGKKPGEVRPRLGIWPGYKASKIESGHFIALRANGKPDASTVAQLATLGFMEQAVLVVRLSQPLHVRERELIESLAGLAATVRVVVVGLPGEEPTETDLAEVPAYAVSQMRQAGFDGGRCLGAGVWFTGGGTRPGLIADLGKFLTVSETEVKVGRKAMLRRAVSDLLADLRQYAERSPRPTQAAVTQEESDRLTGELANYLSDLGRELGRQVETRRSLTTEGLRSYAHDSLHGWGAYTGVEGHWMRFVERLRPGMQAAFLAEADAAVSLLDYEPGREPEAAPSPAGASVGERLAVEAKRAGVGLALGVALYMSASALLDPSAGRGLQGVTALPPAVIALLAYAALLIGIVLGYGIARPIFRQPAVVSQAAPKSGTPAVIHGWRQVERRLTAWFSEHMSAASVSPLEECRRLAERLNIEDTEA
jgi:hypothetical protein